MKGLILLFICILAFSCERKYKYVQYDDEKLLFGGFRRVAQEVKAISAPNDSVAYAKAYSEFCIALKSNSNLRESSEYTASTPVEFKLIDHNANEIRPSVLGQNREAIEKEIRENIFAIKEAGAPPTTLTTINADSARIADSARVVNISRIL